MSKQGPGNVLKVNEMDLDPYVDPYDAPEKGSPTKNIVSHTENYDALAIVLQDAFNQAATGKGHERHSGGKAFTKQPILEIARMLSGIDGHAFQIMKKAQEAARMERNGARDSAIRELYGIINYAAAAVLLIREQK